MKRVSAVGLLTLLAFAAGCAGTPKWVKKGSSAFPPSDKVFYGVGQAGAAIHMENLREETADNRARANLQQYFDTYTGYLMKEYQGEDGQQVDRVIKTFSAGHVSGVRIVDRYVKKETVYSLAKLDLEEFRKVMRNAPELTQSARKFLDERSEKLFDQLKEEEVRQGAVKPATKTEGMKP